MIIAKRRSPFGSVNLGSLPLQNCRSFRFLQRHHITVHRRLRCDQLSGVLRVVHCRRLRDHRRIRYQLDKLTSIWQRFLKVVMMRNV